jgi:hypothetical protein
MSFDIDNKGRIIQDLSPMGCVRKDKHTSATLPVLYHIHECWQGKIEAWLLIKLQEIGCPSHFS